MKIAIFHDYFGSIGGGEKLVLTLARALNADVITTDINTEVIMKMDFNDVSMISLGDTIKFFPFKSILRMRQRNTPKTPTKNPPQWQRPTIERVFLQIRRLVFHTSP